MKSIYAMFSIVLVIVMGIGVGQANDSAQDELLASYIQFLKSGDTQGLLTILGDPLLNRHKDQLQANPSYSSFLANHYHQAAIKVLSIENSDAYTSKALIEINFPGSARPLDIQLLLKRFDRQWKIVDELN